MCVWQGNNSSKHLLWQLMLIKIQLFYHFLSLLKIENHSLNSFKLLIVIQAAMNPRIKGFLVIFIFLSAGMVKSSGDRMHPLNSLDEGGVQAYSRKLLGFDAVLDYDYAGANPKHNPKGRRGGGGRSL
ncbi:uncharacterized protein LOC127259331 [Andrographis paniculata]|uniref:uncharacterized protein LOC127259331 n=1 Tax=Andrographis paniculata TaxID=175694 RepID=UPI0021E8C272|nr:uncharacterized protein LOC127259331 [Andrographis paniculata]